MLFALSAEAVTQAAVNCLAVGGVFLLGQWLTGLAFFLFAPKAPPGLKKVSRLLAGTGLAVLAAIVLFGHGNGWTLFGGGGTGDAKGNGPTEQKGDGTGPATTPVTTTVPTPATRPDGPRVRVTVLGGSDVREERFYRLGEDPPRTFAELVAALGPAKAAHLEVVFPAVNTLPRDHPAVTRLTGWAQANGVSVNFPVP